MKLSCIIPVYNTGAYLRACLDSLRTQTAAEWEAICVDDASTDDSRAILDRYAQDDARIKVVRLDEHAGTGKARNAGLSASTGEWIVFLDGDDVLAPAALNRLSEIIGGCAPDIRLIRFRYLEFKHGESFVWPEHSLAAPRRIDVSKVIEREDFYVYMWEFAYRRDVIGEVAFPTFRRGQDRVFIDTILLNNADSFLSVGDVCYGYRIRSGSSTHSCPDKDVLKDELSHRVRIIETIDRSKKDVPYACSAWLEIYCVRTYHRLVWKKVGGNFVYDAPSRRELMDWYCRELPRLRRARGFTLRARLACRIYGLFFACFRSRFVSFNYPILLERLAVILCDPARVFRSFWIRLSRVLRWGWGSVAEFDILSA